MFTPKYTRPHPQPDTPGPRRPAPTRRQELFLRRFEAALTAAFLGALAAADGHTGGR